jgi:hypothetical protein
MRNLICNTNYNAAAVLAQSATLHLLRMVLFDSGGGILLDGSNFEIVDTILSGNSNGVWDEFFRRHLREQPTRFWSEDPGACDFQGQQHANRYHVHRLDQRAWRVCTRQQGRPHLRHHAVCTSQRELRLQPHLGFARVASHAMGGACPGLVEPARISALGVGRGDHCAGGIGLAGI